MKKTILLSAVICVYCFGIVSAQTWTQKSNHLGAARYDYAGFSINGKGYIGGGRYAGPFNSLSEWQEYTQATDTWTVVTPLSSPFTGLSAFSINGYGYVANGVNDITYNYDTYKYNQAGNNWATLSSMPYPRLYAASTATATKGYSIGGYGFSAEALADLWEYNPVLDLWTEKDTLPLAAARYNATAFSIDGAVYVFGGTDGNSVLNDLWRYDTLTNHWTAMAPMPATGREYSISFVINNEAYIIGGSTSSSEVWKYSPSNNSWLQLPNFPRVHAPVGGVAFTINGKGYIVPANGTSECWEFTPVTASITDNISNNDGVSLFPNPFSDFINLKVSTSPKDIPFSIYDISGRLVYTGKLENETSLINTSNLSKGIYVLKVGEQGLINLKITKQ